MREGSGHVGSDFLSAIAGRVNVSPGRAGSKKSDPWTTLPWTTLDPMWSLQRSQRHILYSWIWLGSKCGMCSFSANSLIRHWGKIKMFAWKVELYTPDCTVSSMNFQNFLGRGSPSPLPRSLPHPISGFAFDSGFDLKSRALRALGLGFTLNSLPICLIISPIISPKGNYK